MYVSMLLKKIMPPVLSPEKNKVRFPCVKELYCPNKKVVSKWAINYIDIWVNFKNSVQFWDTNMKKIKVMTTFIFTLNKLYKY